MKANGAQVAPYRGQREPGIGLSVDVELFGTMFGRCPTLLHSSFNPLLIGPDDHTRRSCPTATRNSLALTTRLPGAPFH